MSGALSKGAEPMLDLGGWELDKHQPTRLDVHRKALEIVTRQRKVCELMNWTPAKYNAQRDLYIANHNALLTLRRRRPTTHAAVQKALDARSSFKDYKTYCAAATNDEQRKKVDIEQEWFVQLYIEDFDLGSDIRPIDEELWNLDGEYRLALQKYCTSLANETRLQCEISFLGGCGLWQVCPNYEVQEAAIPKYITDAEAATYEKSYEEKTREWAYQVSLKRPENTCEENWKFVESCPCNMTKIEEVLGQE